MFQLPFHFSIPDILFEEEMAEEHAYLPELGLQLEGLSGEVVSSAWTLTQKYTNPSRHDCLALVAESSLQKIENRKRNVTIGISFRHRYG